MKGCETHTTAYFIIVINTCLQTASSVKKLHAIIEANKSEVLNTRSFK